MTTKQMSFKLNDHWYRITKKLASNSYVFQRDNQLIDRNEFSAAYKQHRATA